MTCKPRTNEHSLFIRMFPYIRLEIARITQYSTPNHIHILLIPIPPYKPLRHKPLKVIPCPGEELIIPYIVIPQLVVLQECPFCSAKNDRFVTYPGYTMALTRDHIVCIACTVSEAVGVSKRTGDPEGRVRGGRGDGTDCASHRDDLRLEVREDRGGVCVCGCNH